MKKIIIFSLFSGLFLAGCGFNNDKKESSDSKVDQLESRVKELESSSSSEKDSTQNEEQILSNMKSDTNKKIVKAFLDAHLSLEKSDGSNSFEYFPNESDIENSPTQFISQMNFTTHIIEGVSGIGIEPYKSEEELTNGEKYLQEESYSPLYMATNKNILSLMYTYQPKDSKGQKKLDEEFNKYKEVFESIE
ncbi:hypothetical protein [Candidatus Enterococcus ikei]|uniref:Lipoprotein n=1 Tax=Candidatus Enterococcus ikei TaxID=2815326 RepID=A0ABS3GXV1_9ENTE|nr:hypothetical protein [Enterococcus sp. DIV0869a]MBO0439581.1 hypothetical protein [Enterococcus sp. DIV0869a]